MMNKNELEKVLENHLHWLREDCDGWKSMRADLTKANLTEADLTGANLIRANLTEADLTEANLYGANLHGANLCGTNLTEADLTGANLYEANLYGADLTGANLYRANLYRANLYGTRIDEKIIAKFYPLTCPEIGSFVGWKKAIGKNPNGDFFNEVIVKLEILEDAKRSSAFGRKCRCSAARVLAIEPVDDTSEICDWEYVKSGYDRNFRYKVGEIVSVPNFDDDRTHECAPGIHFFITRQEAVDFVV